MPSARLDFLSRYAAFRDALNSDVVVTRPPSEVAHNARARLLRNGLAVIGFAMLEEFIRARTGEVMEKIGTGITPFGSLPDAIREAATVGVVNGLKFQAPFVRKQPGSNIIAFMQDHTRSVASTAGTGFHLSKMAFAWDTTNIDGGTVEAILSAFKVENPWGTLVGVAGRTGMGGLLDLRAAMRRAEERRHNAAHNAAADVEHADLTGFLDTALATAVGFDVLLSKALRCLLDNDRQYLAGSGKVNGRMIKLRFLEEVGTSWKELVENADRATRVHPDLAQGRVEALQRARRAAEVLVVRDSRGFPIGWYTPEVDS